MMRTMLPAQPRDAARRGVACATQGGGKPPHSKGDSADSRPSRSRSAATVRLPDGTILEAELHWYEAHGIGKKEIKFKRAVGIAP
jgi:hypothetical protein